MPKSLEKNSVLCEVSDMAEKLVRSEMAAGCKRPEAEAIVARRVGIARYSLEHLRRGRLKHAGTINEIRERIRSAWVSELERQIARLEDELTVARSVDRQVDLGAVEALLWQAKERLRGP